MCRDSNCYLAVRFFLFLSLIMSPLFANAGAFEQLFAPKPELWNVWLIHNKTSDNHIEHQDWNLFLKNNVQSERGEVNRIAYAMVSDKERNRLSSYIEKMQKISINDYQRDEQLAYWINLYNAVTVDIVLKNYPVESIRDIDISPGFFSDGPWGKKVLNIQGETLSLNDIEHRILRPIWKDARIHFAVNCASLGCPNLQQRAFMAKTINKQLDSAAQEFIAHPRGVRLVSDGVIVSSIFSWFQQDFGETEEDVIAYIQRYANNEMHAKLEGMQFFAGDEYDWSLNDVLELTH